ncbi:helix-turn-helix domain-containing protein [Mesorhizobium sp. SP-1A]|uniref:helix-turn-helix domain-containing protein n=1 Tax=Mesorhizobium sp. SP-1A TaxID=3077840 RepID=UPI0028F6D184|nr:helix-turn-helix domain-containing protein [Mesorhizobium sp. SP-1A]
MQRDSVERTYLTTIREIVSLVNATADMSAIIQNIVDAVCKYTSWDRSVIIAAEPASGRSIIAVESIKEGGEPFAVQRVWKLSTSPILSVIESREPLVIPDTRTCSYPMYSDPQFADRFKTIAFLPLNCLDEEGRDLVLSVHSAQMLKVRPAEIELLQTICHLAAIAVNRAQLIRKERLQSQRLSRSAAAGGNLMAAALEASSPERVMDRLEMILSAPLVVVDLSEGSLWANRSPFASVSDEDWRALLAKDEVFQDFSDLTTASSATGLRHAPYSFRPPLPGLPLTVDLHPLRLDNALVGSLIVFPSNGLLADSEIEKVNAQQAIFALSSYLLRSHLALKNQMLENSRFFAKLFDGSVRDPGRIPYIAKQAGIAWGLPSKLVAIARAEAGSTFENPGELVKQLTRVIGESSIQGTAVEVDGNVIVHLRGPEPSQKAFNSLASRIERALKLGGEAAPILAVSDPIDDASRYASAYQQCLRTVSLAQKSARSGIVSLADFGPFSFLLLELDGETIDAFVTRTLGDIIRRDNQKSSNYLETISALAAASFRLPIAARSLDLHVSTLRYRLARIEQLFHLDLTDDDTRLAVALALRIYRTGGTYRAAAKAP